MKTLLLVLALFLGACGRSDKTLDELVPKEFVELLKACQGAQDESACITDNQNHLTYEDPNEFKE